jgi:hypothetical protein
VIVDELMERVRTAAFREILATGRPVPVTSLAAATATGEADVRAAADRLLAAGRARIDEHGNVTAAAGLSVTPTRHRLQTRHGSRWTSCAYDALGILGALGTDGEVTSSSPLTGQPIRVPFDQGHPVANKAVLFLADEPEGCRPNDEWCPNVNLFEDESSAVAWARAEAASGRAVSPREGTELGAAEWRPLVEGHRWSGNS